MKSFKLISYFQAHFRLLRTGLKSENDIQKMLFWDVNNGIARRNWARNKEATFAIKRAMKNEPLLKVLVPNLVDDKIIENL